MSLDISLRNREDSGDTIDMNWLRNPFGLCQWTEDNVKVKLPKGKTLYYVLNHWNYKKSNKVNRKLFLKVVMTYWEEIQKLEKGYWFFSLPGYMQFIEPEKERFPKAGKYNGIHDGYDDQSRMKIPMTEEAAKVFDVGQMRVDASTPLEYYKNWFAELVRFAEKLQDRKYRFYCSN